MSGLCCDCIQWFDGHGLRCWRCAARMPTPIVLRVSYRLRRVQPSGGVITVVRTPTLADLERWIARKRGKLAIGRCWIEETLAPASLRSR